MSLAGLPSFGIEPASPGSDPGRPRIRVFEQHRLGVVDAWDAYDDVVGSPTIWMIRKAHGTRCSQDSVAFAETDLVPAPDQYC